MRQDLRDKEGLTGRIGLEKACEGVDRVSAAKRMTAEFAKVLDTLEQNPFQFPAETDYNLPDGAYRKALFSKWYKVIFSVSGDTVYLDAVLDCRQDNTDYQPK